jgi:hypothetical protein
MSTMDSSSHPPEVKLSAKAAAKAAALPHDVVLNIVSFLPVGGLYYRCLSKAVNHELLRTKLGNFPSRMLPVLAYRTAAAGKLDDLEYMLSHDTDWVMYDDVISLTRQGNPALRQLLKRYKGRVREDPWRAVKTVKDLKELVREQTPFSVRACGFAAARVKGLAGIQYLRSQGCPWGPEAMEVVVVRGARRAIEFMRGSTPPCRWDEEHTCLAAARTGWRTTSGAAMVRFLRSLDPPAPWSTKVFTAAVENLGAKSVEDLLAAGCPYDRAECHAAWNRLSDGSLKKRMATAMRRL